MPVIDLPSDGEKPYGNKLRAAINAVNDELVATIAGLPDTVNATIETGLTPEAAQAIAAAPAVESSVYASKPWGPVGDSFFATADGTYAAQTGTGTSRTLHRISANATGIRLVYGNWYTKLLSGTQYIDAAGPNALTIRAGIELPAGEGNYPVLFNGKRSVTIEPGGMVISDPIGLTIAPGENSISVRTFIDPAGGSWYPTKESNFATSYGGWVATSDYTLSGNIPHSVGAFFTAMAILGASSGGKGGTFLVGDSIANGTSDPAAFHGSSTTTIAGGYLNRALSGVSGVINAAFPSEQGYRVEQNIGHFGRFSLMSMCRNMICEHGRNDTREDRTASQIEATLINLWRMGRQNGLRVFQTTLTPSSSSTDSWATIAGQSVMYPTQDVERIAVNTWLRAGAPMVNGAAVAPGTAGATVAGGAGHPLHAVFDVAAAAESSLNSGLWNPNYVSDGVHPNATGAAALAGAIDTSQLA